MFLSWNNFSETSAAAFGHFGTNKEFSDVTLASGDGQQVEAHRVVLSVCSPVLRDILMKIPHSHPLLYMKGINMEDLQLILKFLYFGEVMVVQKNLEHFLECANELKIAGLTTNLGDSEGLEKEEKKTNQTIYNQEDHDGFSLNPEQPYKTELGETDVRRTDTNDCDQCGKEHKSGKALMKHRQEEHPGKSYTCNECGKTFATNANVKIHKKSIHQMIKYPCQVCNKDLANASSLFVHKKSKHTV